MDPKNIKLICFDIDGVIFRDINFWMELHKVFGTFKEGKKLTEKYLHSDYDKLVDEVVTKLWKGKDARPYLELVESLEYVSGVDKTFRYIKKKGYKTALISASSIDAAKRIDKDFGVDYYFANELVIADGKISGEFNWPVGAGKDNKAALIKYICDKEGITPDEVVYIGDSDTDIEAFRIVGLSIAFNSGSEKLKKEADIVVDSDDLSDTIYHY